MSAIVIGPVSKTIDGETKNGTRYRQITSTRISGLPHQSALQYLVKLMVPMFDQYEAEEGEVPVVEKQGFKKYDFPVTYLLDHPKFEQVMNDLQELLYHGINKKDAEEAAQGELANGES